MLLQAFEYHQPATLAEALSLLARLPGLKKLLAGGTDLVPAMRRGDLAPDHLVSLRRLEDLKTIKIENGLVWIGSLVTFSQLAASSLAGGPYSLLAQAALQVGGPQIRNQGTVGGNIVNASPAGDLLPPLAALGARLRICREGGERWASLDEFLGGPGNAHIARDEVLAGVAIPSLGENWAGSFVKLGRRKSLAISRMSLALLLSFGDSGAVGEARMALGAVAPGPIRVPMAEALLRGITPSPGVLEEVLSAVAETVSQSLGSRASAPYKRVAVRGVAREALVRADPRFGFGIG